ncbi:MAG: Fe2+-dependent dioxygenase [Solimonas sp.]
MLLQIPDVLSSEQLARCRQLLDAADWVDGNVTSGHQSARAKANLQIPEEHAAAREMGAMILQALSRNPRFIAGALPQHVFPPLFNRYGVGQTFGTHVDNAVRQHRASGLRIRTDLSATLFLAAPEEYDDGELIIEDTYGRHSVKLPAGHLVLYPASSLHHVTPVTRGSRLASFFWIQSMVRDDGERSLLLELDKAIQRVAADLPEHPALVQLTGVYHNLLRRWADV